jgi:hypothetical protein
MAAPEAAFAHQARNGFVVYKLSLRLQVAGDASIAVARELGA